MVWEGGESVLVEDVIDDAGHESLGQEAALSGDELALAPRVRRVQHSHQTVRRPIS